VRCTKLLGGNDTRITQSRLQKWYIAVDFGKYASSTVETSSFQNVKQQSGGYIKLILAFVLMTITNEWLKPRHVKLGMEIHSEHTHLLIIYIYMDARLMTLLCKKNYCCKIHIYMCPSPHTHTHTKYCLKVNSYKHGDSANLWSLYLSNKFFE
jgi:hypothetical protein